MTFSEPEDLEEEQEGQSPAGSGNRNFWIIFSVLGGVLLVALILMAVYAVFIVPNKRADISNKNSTAAAQNAQLTLSIEQTESASQITATPIPTNTPKPSPTITPLMGGGGEASATPTREGEVEATRIPMMTEAAQTAEAALAATQAVPTELTDAGFADEVGLPLLLVLAVVFVMLIFLVRRLRTART